MKTFSQLIFPVTTTAYPLHWHLLSIRIPQTYIMRLITVYISQKTKYDCCAFYLRCIARQLIGRRTSEDSRPVCWRLNPLTPTVVIWVQLWSILCVSDQVKPSFVIFDIWALWRSAVSVRVLRCQKLQNNGLTWSDTGCFIAVAIWQQWTLKG